MAKGLITAEIEVDYLRDIHWKVREHYEHHGFTREMWDSIAYFLENQILSLGGNVDGLIISDQNFKERPELKDFKKPEIEMNDLEEVPPPPPWNKPHHDGIKQYFKKAQLEAGGGVVVKGAPILHPDIPDEDPMNLPIKIEMMEVPKKKQHMGVDLIDALKAKMNKQKLWE